MDQLLDNTYLSFKYCNRWSGILNLDGKYVAVRGFEKEISFIYSLDYLTHDIPVGLLAPSESIAAFSKLFRLLKTINYPLRVVICDDSAALRIALKRYYPKAKVQLCHNHFFQNLEEYLSLGTSDKFKPFFLRLKEAFRTKHHPLKREAKLRHLYYKYKENYTLLGILVEVEKRKEELFAYKKIKHCPATNNMIKSFNSQLKGRFKTIKGFNSFRSAERFLNAWMIRRRTKSFTDCENPFKHLNGHPSLEKTLKKGHNWPTILGLKTRSK